MTDHGCDLISVTLIIFSVIQTILKWKTLHFYWCK